MHETQRYIKAGSPLTTLDELAILCLDRCDRIRRRVAENENASVDMLTRLATDEHPEVRLAVADNSRTPREIVDILSLDEHPDVRYGLAENPNVPSDILQRLATDENVFVSHRAQKTLRLLARRDGGPPIIRPFGHSKYRIGHQ